MNPRAVLLLATAFALAPRAGASADAHPPLEGPPASHTGANSGPAPAPSPVAPDAPAPSQALAGDRARSDHRFVLASVGRAPFARAVGAALDGRVAPRLELGALLLFDDTSFELGAVLTVRPLADAFEGLVLRTAASVRVGRAPEPTFRGARLGGEAGYAFVMHSVYVEATAGIAYLARSRVEPTLGVRVGFAY